MYVGLALLVLGAVALAISEGWPLKDSEDEIVSSESTQNVAMKTEPSAGLTTVITTTPAKIQSEVPAQPQVAPPIQAPSQEQLSPNPPVVEKSTPIEKVAAPVLPGVPGVMRIDFNAECWMSVQTTEGKKIDRIYKQGESFSIPLANVSALILGNAPAAKVFFGDRQVDVMSKGLAQGNVSRLDQQSLQRLQKN